MEKMCAIIPAFNPDERIIEVITSLQSKNFYKIIIVNDGSLSDKYFLQLKNTCNILTHYKNYGKGRAMKTALNYYMNKYSSECAGVVFADCDNQHSIDDIENCCTALLETPDNLILGVRNFNSDNVPHKNRFGNKFTSLVFKYLCGLKISDTQTGLRAMGNSIIPFFLALSGERFEYETNMLLECKRLDIQISEVKIKTVYINGNKSSSFKAVRDSFMIYAVILKYISSSLISFLVDIILFSIALLLFKTLPHSVMIFLSTAISRGISSFVNYILNHKFVFATNKTLSKTIAKYYTLCIIQMGVSYALVCFCDNFLTLNTVIIKIIIDTFLFFISFRIQRGWVFKNEKFSH